MMKRWSLITAALLLAIGTMAQGLPQFAYNCYEGWSYNNPGVELNSLSIGRAQVRLYVDSQGYVLTLISPQFDCHGIDTISGTVRWKSESSAVSLTMALDGDDGMPLDSAVCLPQGSSSEQTFIYRIPVPHGLDIARVRLVSWDATVSTGGAVRTVTLEGITSAAHEALLGDLNGDGRVSITDVTTLINNLLGGHVSASMEVADIDHDGKISISDVTALINMLLSH